MYTETAQRLIEIPIPQETRTYKPVTYKELIDNTLNAIHKSGFSLEKQIYGMKTDGMVATGRYLIKGIEDDDMQLQIAWTNSYDKSKSLKYNIGVEILVCSNGMMGFEGIGHFTKRHTSDIQIITPNVITEYIKTSGDIFTNLQATREEMKQVEIERRDLHELLGRMFFEESFLGSKELNIIKRELSIPTHDYVSKGSLWELYQFTTFALGGAHPTRWMQDHLKAHIFFYKLLKDIKNEKIEDIDFELLND